MGNTCASKKVPDVQFEVDGNTTSCFDKIKCKSSCCVVVETSQNSQNIIGSENVEVSRLEGEVKSHKSKNSSKKKRNK